MEKPKKKVTKPESIETEGNGHLRAEELTAALAEAFKPMQEFQKEVRDRFEELEKKRDGTNQANVIAAKMVYDTPTNQKRRFTRISLRMVDPFSLADACHAILDDDVQKGIMSLGQIRRESIYDHLNSVQGELRNKATELALQQEQNKAEGNAFEEASMGKGL
jgi:hypothetical protein